MTVYELLETVRDTTPIEVWDAGAYSALTRYGWRAIPGYMPWKGTVKEFKSEDTDEEDGGLYNALCEDEVAVEDCFTLPGGTLCILYRPWC